MIELQLNAPFASLATTPTISDVSPPRRSTVPSPAWNLWYLHLNLVLIKDPGRVPGSYPQARARPRGFNRPARQRGYSMNHIPPLGFGTRDAYPDPYDEDSESDDEFAYPLVPYRPQSMPAYTIQQPAPPILTGYQPQMPMALTPQAQGYPTMQADLHELLRLTSNLKVVDRDRHTTQRIIDILVPRAPHEIDALRNAFERTTRTDLSVTLSEIYRQKSFSVQCILVGLSMSPICFDIWLLLRVLYLFLV